MPATAQNFHSERCPDRRRKPSRFSPCRVRYSLLPETRFTRPDASLVRAGSSARRLQGTGSLRCLWAEEGACPAIRRGQSPIGRAPVPSLPRLHRISDVNISRTVGECHYDSCLAGYAMKCRLQSRFTKPDAQLVRPGSTLDGRTSHALASRGYLALCDKLLHFSCPHVLNAAFQGGNIDRSIPDHSGM